MEKHLIKSWETVGTAMIMAVVMLLGVFLPTAAADAPAYTFIQMRQALPDADLYIRTSGNNDISPEDVKLSIKGTNYKSYTDSVTKYKDVEDSHIRIYFVLDSSTSVSEAQFKAIKKSLLFLAKNKRAQDEITIVSIGGGAGTLLTAEKSYDKVKATLDSVVQTKSTNLYEGLQHLADVIREDQDTFIKEDQNVRQIAYIITDWEEVKKNGGESSRQEAMTELQQAGVPLQGYCLKTAKKKLQDDMGEFIRKTGATFSFYKGPTSADNDLLVNYYQQCMEDQTVHVRFSSSQTFSEPKTVELKIADNAVKTVNKKAIENVYLSVAKNDNEAPEVVSVKEDKESKDAITITFNESVLNADNKNNYIISRDGKENYAVSEVNYDQDDGVYEATLILNKKLVKGKYTIKMKNITDATDQRNPIADNWTGNLEGQGIVQQIFSFLGKIWPVLVFVIIAIILLVIYLTVKRHKGLMVVDDKIVTGDNVSEKVHISNDENRTKYIAVDIHGSKGITKQINLQVNDSAMIGRSASNTIYFDDLNMSKQHFAIVVEHGQVYVQDLDSANGTYINGVRIQPLTNTTIQPGDVIRAGNSTMTMRW